MYKAIIDIGGYKAGDEVPEAKAIVWAGMYDESPVEKVGGDADADGKSDDDTSSNDSMHDDYLNRNADVVKNALNDDDLNEDILKSLLKIETANKNRTSVVSAIEIKIDSLD